MKVTNAIITNSTSRDLFIFIKRKDGHVSFMIEPHQCISITKLAMSAIVDLNDFSFSFLKKDNTWGRLRNWKEVDLEFEKIPSFDKLRRRRSWPPDWRE